MVKKHFNSVVKIGHYSIGKGFPCFIIAEAGSNHNRKWPMAKKLVDVAVKAQANAVKFQLFNADKLYVGNAGFADYLKNKQSINDILKMAEMPLKWLPKLFEYCKSKQMLFLCTAFDEESVDAIDPFVLAHKIASYELTHLPLIHHVAKKGKPVILSTAMATLEEIDEALQTIAETGNTNAILMHCVAKYPAPIEYSNLLVIETLQNHFNIPVGLSDHSREPTINPIATAALGGNILEKHFTLSNALPGPDHQYAIEPEDLINLVDSVRKTEAALGKPIKKRLDIENELYTFARRHIHALRRIKQGETFSRENCAPLRSGKIAPGLDPKYYEQLIGRRSSRDIEPWEGIQQEDIL